MNKTININLGGLFFHIDEDAYQKLEKYFDDIKHYLQNSEESDEIVHDIEMRIAEIFTELRKSDSHVIGTKEVEHIISVMGQPEVYKIEDDGNEFSNRNNNNSTYNNNPYLKSTRKLYRDKVGNILGGVCSGLGYYFGIDALWIRLLLIIVVIAGLGSPILVYIIMWIIVPKAKTTSQILEMKGEPINLSSIEKKVKEEYNNIVNKDFSKDIHNASEKIKHVGQNAGNKIESFFQNLYRLIKKIIGLFLIFIGTSLMIALAVSLVDVYYDTNSIQYNNLISEIIHGEYPQILSIVSIVLAAGIPLVYMIITGVRMLFRNLNPINKYIKSSLLIIWIIAIVVTIFLLIKQQDNNSALGNKNTKEIFYLDHDTLRTRMKFNERYANSIAQYKSLSTEIDEHGNSVAYSNRVTVTFLETDESSPYYIVEKKSYGKNMFDASEKASKINFDIETVDNVININNYFVTDHKLKQSSPRVKVFIYVPKNKIIHLSESMKEYITNTIKNNPSEDLISIDIEDNQFYKINGSYLVCTSCEKKQNTIVIDTTTKEKFKGITKDSSGQLTIKL